MDVKEIKELRSKECERRIFFSKANGHNYRRARCGAWVRVTKKRSKNRRRF